MFFNFNHTVMQEQVPERLDVVRVVAVAEVVWDPRLVEDRVVIRHDLEPSQMPKPANTFVVRCAVVRWFLLPRQCCKLILSVL